jgi:agmatine deiminase
VREHLQSLFPEREIVLVRIDHIAEGGVGIHCITQQQPLLQ